MEHKDVKLREQKQQELQEKACREFCKTLVCCLGTFFINLTFLYCCASSDSSKNS